MREYNSLDEISRRPLTVEFNNAISAVHLARAAFSEECLRIRVRELYGHLLTI